MAGWRLSISSQSHPVAFAAASATGHGGRFSAIAGESPKSSSQKPECLRGSGPASGRKLLRADNDGPPPRNPPLRRFSSGLRHSPRSKPQRGQARWRTARGRAYSFAERCTSVICLAMYKGRRYCAYSLQFSPCRELLKNNPVTTNLCACPLDTGLGALQNPRPIALLVQPARRRIRVQPNGRLRPVSLRKSAKLHHGFSTVLLITKALSAEMRVFCVRFFL
jgi:hypothetical protein